MEVAWLKTSKRVFVIPGLLFFYQSVSTRATLGHVYEHNKYNGLGKVYWLQGIA